MPRYWPTRFTSQPATLPSSVGYEDVHAQIANFCANRSGGKVALLGPRGAGKTGLAHRLSMDPAIIKIFQEGTLWARPVAYVHDSALLGAWAEGLGANLSRESRVEQRTSAMQSLLEGRNVLIVLDGVTKPQSLTALDCGGSECVTILTTRDADIARSFAGSNATWMIEGWTLDQANQFLSIQFPILDWRDVFNFFQVADRARISPQVLEMLAGHLNAQRNFPGILTDPDSRTRTCMVEGFFIPEIHFEREIEAVIADFSMWCLASLPEKIRDVFVKILAFASEPDSFSTEAAKHLADATSLDIDILVACRLIERDGQQLIKPGSMDGSLSHYLSIEGQRALRNYYFEMSTQFSGDFAEVSDIYGQCMFTCQNKKLEENRREIVNALTAYQEELGLWEDYRTCGELALQACKAHSLCQEEGRLCNNLGKAAHMLDDIPVAMNYYRLAEDLLRIEGEIVERALVKNNIASLLVEGGQHEEAQAELLQALLIIGDRGDHHIRAYLHNNLGKIYDDLALPILARDEYLKALQLLDSKPDPELELTIRFNLALVYQAQGKKQEALAELQQAVKIEEMIGHPNFAEDAMLLDKLRVDQSEPKVFKWIRKKIIN